LLESLTYNSPLIRHYLPFEPLPRQPRPPLRLPSFSPLHLSAVDLPFHRAVTGQAELHRPA
jgi:hypothetical protein